MGSSTVERRCRNLVHERSGGLCERCGLEGHTYHHRKNRGQGGQWSYVNIVFLCGDGTRGCHGWVTVNPAKAHDEGFHVKPWEDPAEIPVLTWRGERLFDDMPVVPPKSKGTASTRPTPPVSSYSEPVDMQDKWFEHHPE